ncbi:hypothetical protein A0J57_17035 [Sphingobium sp. 22B]|uniref:DUF5335 domain-containing protein n=1 Tax=unclassified Sphingobium TaxID=2611147 RepID=UPI000783C631|nr:MULTISPECIES: DUF5335 domain-containing protein [unclassified Sphingobium]KXU31494.1 hypothetical protein AXW74_12445 [Sphingobium sp. AM]KYC31148.1 hypothetical protein A0J57_17035 [Sphingobium sp. 22B]OAP31150.1 hypothetical protein A8O16_14940 [Sphingobium sp. 20006FA]
MAAEQIDRATWSAFLDTLTKTLIGKQAEIEVAALDLGDQIEAEWTPLIGITYDEKGDLIEIALDALDHLIRSPRSIFVDHNAGGIVAIAINDGDGRQHIVKLKDPLGLPAPETTASQAGGR